jgi:DNA-directed RNA polymerase specialized sigma24 family protein
MAVEPEILASAIKLRPRAVGRVLEDQCPCVYRLAYALAGRWDVGRGVARFVLTRAVQMMPKWETRDDPANWFHRYTIMTSRRSSKHAPEHAKKDVLVEQAIQPDGQYIAFVSALRHLDAQPREAFLLNHCEHLNSRYAALAMDCSTQAAENHLRVADQALRLVAAEHFDALVRKLADAYQHLTPAPDDLLPAVNRVIFRQVRVRRWMRVLRWIAILAFVLAALWGVYKLYEMVRF